MDKILHYVGAMNHGGMENLIMNVYRNIDKSKYQFDFAVHTKNEADMDKEIIELGGRIIPFPSFRSNPIRYRKVWNDFWRENHSKYKVFHFHTDSLANIEAIKAALNYRVSKIIIHAHSASTNKGKLQLIHNIVHKINQHKISKKKNIVLASVSDEASQWVFGEVNDRIQKINNGIDYKKFRYNKDYRELIRDKYRIQQDEIVLGHTGTFVPVKNHKKLISILKGVLSIDNNIKLMLVGGGPMKKGIKENVFKDGIADKVIFVGNTSEVNKYLSAMDIFLFPSFYEGLPLSLIEAQVNGLPVLASKNISREVIISNNINFLDINDNNKSWISQILELKSNYRRNHKEVVDDKFKIEETVLRFMSMYN
ncbi:glycosyltransferase [Aerococcus sp. Group 2]|uniref:glycosyltransferase n=1 Tax=Aerococcus sp. Group 2 TaxID=2976811 RepID=UPI00227C948F|nr:glycosyltransferase [Aerococcus sp. Group 2]MCY3040025.1 glycosyltransferase [Aerococcus sp. Group 2]MCY3040739.1 glycosyltransferase [Aerococcus sp. Group 2]MCY3042731.1 glycosyltransferase [Aerococcus sp. Group 2]